MIFYHIFILLSLKNVTHVVSQYQLEEVSMKNKTFQGKYSSCRGITISGIYLIQCAAICCDPTSPLWSTEGYFPDGQRDYCYCFLFNETEQADTGSCTVCFEDSSLLILLDLNNVISTFMYAKPSVFCKYLM